MKKVVKKIQKFIEKIFHFKFTRTLTIETSNDLYNQIQTINNELISLKDKMLIRQSSEKYEMNSNDFYRNEFTIVNDVWRRNGYSQSLTNHLEFLFQSTLAWNNCPHELWLIYISVLLENNDNEKAEMVWNQYINKYSGNIKWIHRYILVANFVCARGFEHENLDKAKCIYNNFVTSRKEKRLENILINAESIAIVGNGPAMVGKNKGEEIDNHEIIIRFNNFMTYGYENDYGKKTNIWVKCSNDDIKHDRSIDNFELILYEADYMHHPLELGYHNYIFHDIEYGAKIDYIDFATHRELRDRLGGFPSTGLLIIWIIYKLGLLYKTDLYGFSFQQDKIDTYASHYFNDRDLKEARKKSQHHSFDRESLFINKMILGDYDEELTVNDVMNANILNDFLKIKKEKEQIRNVETVHSLTYRPFAPNGGAGGGGAVLSCQKVLLGDYFDGIEYKYSFFEINKYTKLKGICDLHDLWGGAYFAIEKTKEDSNTIYVTHDYGTAFGLFILGKHYVYINHLQGPRAEEKTNFNEKATDKSFEIIKQCEKMVCENAEFVCFPSKGAADYFEKSCWHNVDLTKYKRGPVLYNTLYAFPVGKRIDYVEKDTNKLTILSVGQLTVAKGIDQCIPIIRSLLENFHAPIRWIIVGRGPLKNTIIEQCEILNKKFRMFSYIHIEKCVYEEMVYLQDLSDVYLMCQRISIFDLTTLEMMKRGKIIVLSNVGGNPEFNKNGNIILYNGNNNDTSLEICDWFKNNMGNINVDTFEQFFSQTCFVNSYHAMINEMIKLVVSKSILLNKKDGR